MAANGTPSASHKPYSTEPGQQVASPRFAVTYRGSGTYRTHFKAHPPNPDGKDDKNEARDSSRQSWKVKFRNQLAIPTCGAQAGGGADPCESLKGISGASGPTALSGRVNHTHVDGLYRQLDRTVKCKLRKSPSARRRLDASISLRYIPETQSIGITATNPIATAVALFPAQCPKQGDSIDRIGDFYAMPGFSFADQYGPERWFRSREVVVPADDLHRSAKITIPLADTPRGTPPRRCAVRDPSFESCTTGGSWSGTLTLTRKPPATTAAAAASAAKVKPPKSGSKFTGRPGEITAYISGRSIQLVAFSFKCRSTSGATSLTSIPLRKTKRGYRFGIHANGIVTYADDHADENGAISISGRFSRTGKSVAGKLRVKTPRCGSTGQLNWRAAR
jgi:hypothetical protein